MTPIEAAEHAYSNLFHQHRNMFEHDGKLIIFANIGETRESRTEATRLRKALEQDESIVRDIEGPEFVRGYTWAIVANHSQHPELVWGLVREQWQSVIEAMKDDGIAVRGQAVGLNLPA